MPATATPLFVAAQHGHMHVVERLIAARADVNKACTGYGVTPLYMATQWGHALVVERLIAARADVNTLVDDAPSQPAKHRS